MRPSNFPSIYEAELRQKLGQEDRLTSRFFGHISRMPSRLIIEYLKMAKIIYGDIDDGIELEKIELWPRIKKGIKPSAEIDAVIHLNYMIIVVEVKFISSKLTKDQLIREYKYAVQRYPNSRIQLSTITADEEPPSILRKVEATLDQPVSWISWIQCRNLINEIASDMSNEGADMQNILDLVDYFDSQGILVTKGLELDYNFIKHAEVDYTIEQLLGFVKGIFEEQGFSNTSNNPWFHGTPAKGAWGLRTDEQHGERGFWFAVTSDGEHNQFQFSAYEESWSHIFENITKLGYEKSEYGKSQGWVGGNYVAYSKYLDFSELSSGIFDVQKQEIKNFVLNCLSEIESNCDIP